jgi:membrane-bound serine protease (ClpP class)
MLNLPVFAGLLRQARPAPPAPHRPGRPALILTFVLAAPLPALADVPVVELVGIVHAVSAAHVVSAIDRADAAKAPLVVLRLDTPGGLDTSMRQIIDKILNCRTPVAVFVGPSGARAASAGFLIAIAADVAAMAPGTNIGAAHPVSATGPLDEVMARKVTSDAAAYIRSKAERRGRNPELAEKAVVESRSFTEKEALDGKLIDLVVKDVPELLAALDGREITRFDGSKVTLSLKGERTFLVTMNWRQGILSLIARPETLFLLLLGALAGLGTEISHPGLLFPGIVGVLCLILFLFASQILPVNGAGVLLIVLAVALFAAEAKIPAYGLLTASGITAMILGAMMLIEAPIPEMRLRVAPLIALVLAMAVGTSLLVRMVVAAQRLRPSTGEAGMQGQPGTAETALGPEGWVRVQGELWRAVAEAPVEAGEAITVASVEGLRLRVRKGA